MTQLEQDIKDKEVVVEQARQAFKDAWDWYEKQADQLIEMYREVIKENEF